LFAAPATFKAYEARSNKELLMLDIIAFIALALLPALALLYVKGCDRLKGSRP